MSRSQRHMRFIHGYDSGEYPPWWGPVNEPPQVPPLPASPPPEIYPRELSLTAIDPTTCKLDDPPFTATLTGTAFLDGCTIEAHTEDGTDSSFTPTFVNETTLSWGVNPSTVPAPTKVWFHVKNPTDNESNDMVFEFLAAADPPPPPAPVKYK